MDVLPGQGGPNVQGLFGRQARRGISGLRIVVLVLVTGLHLALVTLLLRAPPASRRAPLIVAKAAGGVLHLRFLRHEPPKSAPPLLPRRRQQPIIKIPSSRASRRRLPAPATAHAAEKITTNIVATDKAATYIAGGGFLERTSRDTRSGNTHLSGSSRPIVNGLHMVDPRSQGIGGAVRVVQAVFGVPDPHCVNVEGWRGMSVRELLDRHMSPDQMEKTAQAYHCGPGG